MKQKQLPLTHFLTFTSHLTPMDSFLPDSATKKGLQFCYYKLFTPW